MAAGGCSPDSNIGKVAMSTTNRGEMIQNLLKQFKNGLIEINFHYEERERLLSIIAELSSYDVGPIPSNIELILNLPEFET